MSIPKKIHYCWFGRNPLPESAKKCIESWKKYCPAPRGRATVIKQYRHHVLVENAKGTRCCITNAEIYGMEKRKGVQEAAGMRDSSGKEVDVKESKRRFPALEFGKERRR